jgi:ribosomal 50S subunit-associated protein YjgA (DUF615 family)
MATDSPSRSFDELAAELESVAKRAKAAAADASLTAELATMGGEAEAATLPIAEATSVLYDSERITLNPSEASELDRRRQWLGDQLERVLEQFREDPTKIRRGPLWKDTKQAIEHLRQELFTLRDEHYQALLAEYPDDDGEHLRSLPPDTTGLDEYVRAIDAFERARSNSPTSAADVDRAVTAGERLRDCRAQVESEAVPAEFRIHWRQLRGGGLALTELTEELRAWLSAHGIEDEVVLRLRT